MVNDILTFFTQSTGLHPLAALLIGILVAVNPCQIAICISAIFVKKTDNSNLSSKLAFFASGRAASYLVIGAITMFVYSRIKDGIETYRRIIADSIDTIIPYFSIIAGIFFIYRVVCKHHHNDNCHNSRNIIQKNKFYGMFFLGALLALLFCPESAFLYFGMLIPLAINSQLGFINIIIFAFSAVLPLIIIAFICYKAEYKINTIELKLEKFQNIMNIIAAIILIALGLFMIIYS